MLAAMRTWSSFVRRIGVWTLFAVVTFSSLATAATDEERAAARALAEQGAQAFKKEEYQRAVDLFSRAEALIHSPVHLLYLARSHRELGQLVKARESYIKITREKLEPGAPKVFFQAQRDAGAELDAIEPKLASLTVVVEGAPPEDVRLTLDDEVVPAVLIGVPMPVDPGTHELVASAAHAEERRQSITLREGQTERLSFALDVRKPPEEEVSKGAPPEAGTEPGDSIALPVIGWTTVGLGAIGLGITYYLLDEASIVDATAESEYDVCNPGCTTDQESRIEGLGNDAADMRTGAAVVGPIAGAALVTGVVLLIVHAGSDSDAASLTPAVGPSWIGVSGRF
jgi:hypothetical protein